MQHTAYPALRLYCQQQGFDIELVDVEWGSMGAVNPRLRGRELDRCQTESVGPHMVVSIWWFLIL